MDAWIVGWSRRILGRETSVPQAYMILVVLLAASSSLFGGALLASGGVPMAAVAMAGLGAFHLLNLAALRVTGQSERFDLLALAAPLVTAAVLGWQLRGTGLADLGVLLLLPVIAWAAMFGRAAFVRWSVIEAVVLALAMPVLPRLVLQQQVPEPWLVEGVRVFAVGFVAVFIAGPILSLGGTRKRLAGALREEHARSERLLHNVLPAPVAARLKDGATVADHAADATVLFVDLVGFTELSATMTPIALVARLDRLFSSFDELARRHGLEKIKTIGDAWMVVGGVPSPREDHAEAVARLALDILATVRDEPDLQVRIGLHSGPLVAGVIGRSKFAYDVWGDTVNLASRLESHGEAGRIQVSAEVARRLGDRFRFEERGTIAIKGRGEVATAWLVAER